MDIAHQKLNLIGLLMRVSKSVTLNKVEELLVKSEMEARAEESLHAIALNDTVTLEQFNKDNATWLKKKATK